MRRKFHHRIYWTNWTFGPWWGWIGRNHYIAFDLGPLQMTWVKERAPHRRGT